MGLLWGYFGVIKALVSMDIFGGGLILFFVKVLIRLLRPFFVAEAIFEGLRALFSLYRLYFCYYGHETGYKGAIRL